MQELKPADLRWRCAVTHSKKQVSLEKIVDQPRFTKSFEAGLSVKDYNVYASNFDFDGSDDVIASMISRLDDKSVPGDIVCLQNFGDPNKPRIVYLPQGVGKKLESDMGGLVDVVLHNTEKIVDDVVEKLAPEFSKIQEIAKKKGITLKMDDPDSYNYSGIGVSEETIKKFRDEHIIPFIKNVVSKTLDGKKWKDFAEDKIEARIEEELERIKLKYSGFASLAGYFAEIKDKLFAEPDPHNDGCVHELCEQFEVNILVDNSKAKRAPVIFEDSPQFGNLVGKIRERLTLSDKAEITNFRNVSAGSLIKANGGYIILDLDSLIEDPLGEAAYIAIKRALQTKKVKIAHPYSAFGNSCDVENIDVDVKVILKGSMGVYRWFWDYDTDFKDLFKAHADFDWTVNNSAKNRQNYASFFDYFATKNNLLPVDAGAKSALVEHAAVLAENREKLSTDYDKFADIIKEADLHVRKDGRKKISRYDIEKIVEKQFDRNTLWYEKEQEWVSKISLVRVSGKVVGQINGLVVNDLCGAEIGWPERITASVGVGKSGIVHPDVEADFAGPVLKKSTYIIEAYLLKKYCKDKPLQISAKVTFEQNYNNTDGDSASSTEIYALLSALSDVPIKQNIAVTGSVDQFGHVQPIGGVNAKIAGFYDICKRKGELSGHQGVMIPYRNKKHLMLRQDIVKAVKDGKFHIYAVKIIDEGIEVLTEMPAKSIDDCVNKKLYKLAMAYEKFGKTES